MKLTPVSGVSAKEKPATTLADQNPEPPDSMRRATASKPRIGSLAVPLPVGGQTTGTDAKAMRGTWPVSKQCCSKVAARTADSRPSVCGFSR